MSQQSQIQRNLPLKIRHCGVRRHNKIDHPDRPETTEGHHGDHYTDDIGPDQRREDQGQRAARTPRCRPRTDRRSVNRSRGRARNGARQQDAALRDPHRLPPRKQRPPSPPGAAGDRQRQPQSSQRDANPAHRASASASSPWLPARPDRNFTWRAQPIVRTMSASLCGAISARDGSRSVMANCMQHRPQQSRHTRQPDSEP